MSVKRNVTLPVGRLTARTWGPVTTLVPQLRPSAGLGQKERHDLLGPQPPLLGLVAKPLLRQVPGQHTGVVAVALHRAGVARDPMLPHSLRPLHDRAREIDAADCRTLPERCLGRDA